MIRLPADVEIWRATDGDVWLTWGKTSGGPTWNEQSLQRWMEENCAPGTEAEIVGNGWGEIHSITFKPPMSYTVQDNRTAGRRFRLVRHEDVSGVSGIGVVAHGVQWPDGTVSVRWAVPGLPPSFANWEGLDALLTVHGHHGKTEAEWID